MSYLVAGAWHFAAAMAFAVALGVIGGDDVSYWLRQPAFTAALVASSSALFFIPDRWAKKGPLKFLHYPLPDWDVLLLGPASHRHWITHSPVMPVLLLAATLQAPVLLDPSLRLAPLMVGLCAGTGSHLFWDCVGSRRHRIVLVPYWLSVRPSLTRVYLLAGAAVSLGVAVHFSVPHAATRMALVRTYLAPGRHAPVSASR